MVLLTGLWQLNSLALINMYRESGSISQSAEKLQKAISGFSVYVTNSAHDRNDQSI